MAHPFRDDDRVQAAERALTERFDHDQDRLRLREAVELAGRHHHGQRRKSGEPFLLHPLAVADVLAAEGLPVEAVIAGVLHDALEDTDCPRDAIQETFGDEVLALVEGVTKVTKVAPRGTPQRDKPDTFRKLVLGAADDARVLVIKLADRLHNMRTIEAMPAARQQEIATETLEIYAPIAHRLGMHQIKSELEDRSLRVIDPSAWEEARLVQQERVSRLGAYLEELQTHAHQALTAAGIDAQLSTRVKSRFSIAEKLRRRGDREQMLDVLGMRVIVDTEADCYRALGVLHKLWPPIFDRFKDYIATPKSNLYQSLHTTVINPNGRPCELQIRTRRMHETAEHGIAAHWHYKESLRDGGPASTRQFLQELADTHADERLEEAFAALKQDVLGEEIYAFTPDGDILLLPAGSCAIDFAYAVHSGLGDRCVGARINGELKPITRPLRAGDVVQIISRPESSPSPDWLNVVATPRAKQRIRRFHLAANEHQRIRSGTQALVEAFRNAGMGPLAAKDRLRSMLRDVGYDSVEQAALEVDREPAKARRIVREIVEHLAVGETTAVEPEPIPVRQVRRLKPDEQLGVLVEGLDGVKVRLAQCCAPEPGDEIVGYVSLNRGVSVHRADCNNMREHRRRQSPRLVGVAWQGAPHESFRSEIELVFSDRPELLSDIALAVYGTAAELAELNLKGDGRIVRGIMACVVQSADHAEQVRAELGQMQGALRVCRRGPQTA